MKVGDEVYLRGKICPLGKGRVISIESAESFERSCRMLGLDLKTWDEAYPNWRDDLVYGLEFDSPQRICLDSRTDVPEEYRKMTAQQCKLPAADLRLASEAWG